MAAKVEAAHLPASLAVINPSTNEVQPDSYLHMVEISQRVALANEDVRGQSLPCHPPIVLILG